MRKLIPLALTYLLLCGWISGFSQELSAGTFISLAGKKIPAIDSLMIQKGFQKQVASSDDDFDIITYTYLTKTSTGVIQRSLHLGWRKKIHVLELQYGVWQKQEAADFINQLLRQGFTKRVISMPDVGGASSSKRIEYRKERLSIGYEEMEQGGGLTVSIFTIEKENP